MKWINARRRHPLAGYAVVVLALALLGGVYSVVAPDNADRAQAQVESADADIYEDVDISNGKQIFTQSCASCHGMGGEGTESGPSLVGVGAASVNFQVSTGRMPSMDPDSQMPRKEPVYDREETADVAAYVAQEFGGGPEIPVDIPGEEPERAEFEEGDAGEEAYEQAIETYEAEFESYVAGGDIDAGKTLYLTNCAQCHSWSGTGGALTDGHYAPPIDEASPRQLYEAMLTGPGAMPVFDETLVTPEEKQDIVTHVEELRMEADAGGIFNLNRIGQTAEGFMAWTIGMGLTIATAVWITAKQRAHD